MKNRGYYLAILYFMHSDWPCDVTYTTVEVADHFGIHVRHMRYYLKRLVRERKLACIKWGRHSYYIHRWAIDYFSHFDNITIIK